MVRRELKARARLMDYALGLPEAWEDNPWGERVAKVNKKVFAFMGIEPNPGHPVNICVKLPLSGDAVLDLPFAKPAGYGLGKSGWVQLTFPPGEAVPEPLVRAWIEESYRAIAPKTLVKQLDEGSAPHKKVTKKVRAKKKVTKKKASNRTKSRR